MREEIENVERAKHLVSKDKAVAVVNDMMLEPSVTKRIQYLYSYDLKEELPEECVAIVVTTKMVSESELKKMQS